MKRILVLSSFLFFFSIAKSQALKSYLPTPAFSAAIQKIVYDFRYGFYHLQIDSLSSQDNGYETYASSVTIPGSTDNIIQRYHSEQDTSASYQCTFYQGESYDEAVKSYKTCIHLLKKSLFGWLDKSPATFTGKEEDPDPNVGFASTTLRTNNKKDHVYKNFCAQIDLTGGMNNWKVQLSFEAKAFTDEDGASQ